MDLERIIQELNRRFVAPLPEFYKRRIIFWYDEDREFEDQLEDMSLAGVKIARLTGSNTFAVKKLLCEDDTSSNYLVYDPRSFTRDDDNWLINVQLYSEEFRADLNSIWMDEMGLPATPIIRSQVKNYRKFFRAKDRRDAVKKLNSNISTAAQMHLAVMSALCGNTDINPSHIIKAVVLRDPDQIGNPKQELKRLFPDMGQIDSARRIAPFMNIENNRSYSFQVFVDGVRKLCEEMEHHG